MKNWLMIICFIYVLNAPQAVDNKR